MKPRCNTDNVVKFYLPDGGMIWREKTAEERYKERGGNPRIANLYIIKDQLRTIKK